MAVEHSTIVVQALCISSKGGFFRLWGEVNWDFFFSFLVGCGDIIPSLCPENVF